MESKKDKIFETLREDGDKAVLERHVYMGMEQMIDYIDLLAEQSRKENINKPVK